MQFLPEHGPEEAARAHEAQLQALPDELLLRSASTAAAPRGLPRLDLVLAGCGAEGFGLGDVFPSSPDSPPAGGPRWVLPDPSQGQASRGGGVCLSLEAVMAANQIVIHH